IHTGSFGTRRTNPPRRICCTPAAATATAKNSRPSFAVGSGRSIRAVSSGRAAVATSDAWPIGPSAYAAPPSRGRTSCAASVAPPQKPRAPGGARAGEARAPPVASSLLEPLPALEQRLEIAQHPGPAAARAHAFHAAADEVRELRGVL